MLTPNTMNGRIIIMDNTAWQLNPADTGSLDVQCTGLGGGELDQDWEVLLACTREAHVYGPSLSKQDDWNARAGTVAGTAHTQEYLLLHVAMFPIGLHTWCHVLGVPDAHQLQAQIISRARKLLRCCPIPGTQETTMARIPARPTTLHQTACGTPIGRSMLAP